MTIEPRLSSNKTHVDTSRRNFLAQAGAGVGVGIIAAGMAPTMAVAAETAQKAKPVSKKSLDKFWPNGNRLVISISMQFEAGGQPAKGADSPFPKVDFPENVPSDAATNSWFAYGYREGIPRMLDLWDRHGVKVTSHMIGEAAQRHPELAR